MKHLRTTFITAGMAIASAVMAQGGFVPVVETYNYPDNEPAPVHPVPSHRQLLWQETEFYAFFHFGMNTFTNAEWGNGSEAESRFAPTKLPNPRHSVFGPQPPRHTAS